MGPRRGAWRRSAPACRSCDPQAREVTWEFRGEPARPLHSLRSGSAEVLANGNILIVETDRGRVLEVTPDKQLVWEFQSPYRTGEEGNLVAMVYSLDRIDEESAGWLETRSRPGRADD